MAELKRVAGYGMIIALTIGSVMGTGLFMGPAIGAKIAGNASILSWLILSAVSLYIASCFGELVAMFPKAGGVYEFGKQTYGRFISFLIGWLAWLVGNITTVVLIVAGIDYLLPGSQMMLLKVLLSCFFLVLLNIISLLGMESSSATVIIFTVISLTVVLSVVVPGAWHVNTANYTPFFTSGASSVLVTIFYIAEGFFGWEAASYLAEETKNPEKIIPRSLMIATGLVAAIAVALIVVSLGIIPATKLAGSSAPFIDAAEIIFGSLDPTRLSYVLSALSMGVYLTMLGCASGNVITMPRLLLALSRDKLFLKQFAEIHPKYSTPYKAIYFQLVVSILILLVGLGSYTTLLSLLVPLGFIMYATVLLSIPILRFKRPEIERKFKAPLGKVIPFFVVGFFILLVVLWIINVENSASILGVGLSLILLGVPLYMLIELYNDPEMIADINDLLAYLTLVTERINIPKSVISEIMSHMGELKGKSVLEFGCGVGTLTKELAEAVGPSGKIYATSFSRNHIKITNRRIDNQNWESDKRMYGKVRFIHDTEHTSRVHPDVGRVDAAVSIGMISYTQEIKKVLGEMNRLMPEGGKICFVDYGDFFHVLPNVDWLSDNKKIESIFRECGFSVQVKRKEGIFWSYIYIYGMKSNKDVLFI